GRPVAGEAEALGQGGAGRPVVEVVVAHAGAAGAVAEAELDVVPAVVVRARAEGRGPAGRVGVGNGGRGAVVEARRAGRVGDDVEGAVLQPGDAVNLDADAVVDVLGEGEGAVGVVDLARVDPGLVVPPRRQGVGLAQARRAHDHAAGGRRGRVEGANQVGFRQAGDEAAGAAERAVDGDVAGPGDRQAEVGGHAAVEG